MPDGGRLTVTATRARDELSGWREPRMRDDRVEIRFRDTGPGVPPEARDHVFVPFYTTKEKGTGLGLAISQRIVKAHRGTLTVANPPGGGAEFTISLPAIEPEPPRDAPAPSAPAAEPRRARRRRR